MVEEIIKERYTIVSETKVVSNRWELHTSGGRQLPCGCIGADYWTSPTLEQGECTACGRGWWHMCVKGPYCVMLDGKPQGSPCLVLTKDMIKPD